MKFIVLKNYLHMNSKAQTSVLLDYEKAQKKSVMIATMVSSHLKSTEFVRSE
ncbi:hypothetical protein J28TS4_40260 [Paenibacillus lautus]|nr:hypothetical protein J28TS4_40260 [Paenibacillus lautus]